MRFLSFTSALRKMEENLIMIVSAHPKFSRKPSRKSGGYYNNSKGGTRSGMGCLKKAHIGVMGRCSKTFGHIVYAQKSYPVLTAL